MEERIIDTCVVSYLLKKHSLAEQYRPLLKDKLLSISFMTVAELYRWIIERNWGKKRIKLLEETLQNYVVLSSDDETCQYWAKVRSIKGQPISDADAWIAATALRYNTPLVTHNVKHFKPVQDLGLKKNGGFRYRSTHPTNPDFRLT
jgi:tRNA(fMet)-specific endonuclease VapC